MTIYDCVERPDAFLDRNRMQEEDKYWPQWNSLEDLKKPLDIPLCIEKETSGLLLGKA